MKIKYMGSADVKRMDPGEDFGGQLATPLGVRVEWNWDNKHVVDTTDDVYSEVSTEFWDLCAQEPDMLDVTDEEVIPLNAAQKLWKGMRDPGDPIPPGLQDSDLAVVPQTIAHPAPPLER